MKYDKYVKTNNNSSGKISIDLEFLVLSLIVSLIIVFVIAIPAYKQTKILKEQNKLIEKSIELKKEVLNKVKEYNQESDDLNAEDLEKFRSLLSNEDKTENYIANINKIANTAGSRVVIKGFSIGKIENVNFSNNSSANFKKVKLKFALRGDFSNLMSFLDTIEKSIPLADLNNIEISSLDAEDDMNYNEIDDSGSVKKNTYIEAKIVLSYYFI